MGQGLDLAFGGENKHLLRKEVQFEGAQELHRVFVRMGEYLFDLLNPFVQSVVALAGFVFPVGGVAVFCYLVHAVRADLHLHPFAVLAHHGHMQRLVSVRFGCRDPVADALRVRTVDLRDRRVDHPALVFLAHRLVGREDDSHRHQVIYVLEGALLPYHLLPNRIDRFDAGFHCEGVAHALQPLTDRSGEGLVVLQLAAFDGL